MANNPIKFDPSGASSQAVGDVCVPNISPKERQLRKKFRRLREAADQFRHDAPVASDHTNFKQAVISMDACISELERLLAAAPVTEQARLTGLAGPEPTLDDNASTPDDDET